MGGFDISFAGALLAGFLSFASPCVLPLIPAYICFIGGTTLEELTADDGIDRALWRRVVIAALAFVFGFSTVFILLGATATAASRFVAENIDVLSMASGAVIILFGLHYMGALRIPFLNFEKRYHSEKKPAGIFGSYLLGLAFGFGWTPCVGPILATILMVAAGSDDIWRGVALLSVYAAGLGIPFLIAAAAVRPFMTFLARFRKHMRKVELAIGGLLVLTGVAIMVGWLAEAAYWLQELMPAIG